MKKRKRLIFCSHGRLCEGILDTLKIFSLFDDKTMKAIPFFTGKTDGEAQLDELAASITAEDQVLIFTDIAYGSVNQQVLLRFSDWDNVYILTGMNLPLILELVASQQEWSCSLIETKVEEARKSILFCRNLPNKASDEDE